MTVDSKGKVSDLTTGSGRGGRYFIFLFVAVVVFVAALSVANVILGDLNQDEGWYLYASRLVSGGSLPYRDFAFTQGPVLPFVYAPIQPLIEHYGLIAGRAFSSLLFISGCLVSSVLAAALAPAGKKRAGALLALTLVGVNAYQSYFSSVVKTYSLGSLILLCAFLALLLAFKGRRVSGGLLCGILLGFAAGARLSAGIALPVIGLCLLFFHLLEAKRGKKKGALNKNPVSARWIWLWFGVGGVMSLAVCFAPFFYMSFDNAWFWLIEYHSVRNVDDWISSVMLKGGSISRLIGSYFVAFAAFICALVWVLSCKGKKAEDNKEAFGASFLFFLSLWLSVAAIAAVHLMAPFPYDEYQVMVFPLFALATAGFVMRAISKEKALPVSMVILILSVASVFSSPVVQNWYVLDVDRLWVRLKDKPPVVKLQGVGSMIKDLAPVNSLLLTQDVYLAVESRMNVPHGMELGQFCYFPGFSTEKALQLNVLNKPLMEELLFSTEASVAAFSGYGFAVESPQVKELPAQEREQLFDLLEERYVRFRNIPDFGQAYTMLNVYLLGGMGREGGESRKQIVESRNGEGGDFGCGME